MNAARHATMALALGAGLAVFLAAGGCQQPLFPEDLPRTQFERYQTLRGKYRRTNVENPYGARQPPLRERLAPLEQQ